MSIKSDLLGVGTSQKYLLKAPHTVLLCNRNWKPLSLNESFCLYLSIFPSMMKKTICIRITKDIFLKMIVKIILQQYIHIWPFLNSYVFTFYSFVLFFYCKWYVFHVWQWELHFKIRFYFFKLSQFFKKH